MTKTEKQGLILKLMVIAINKAIKSGAISLDGVSTDNEDKHQLMRMVIDGKPAVLNWFDAGYDELRITIWWDYQPGMMTTWRKKFMGDPVTSMPQVSRGYFRHILGACGSCYMERRTGKYIMGYNGNQFFDTYVRDSSVYDLEQMQSEQPAGYATYGKSII